MDFFGWELCYNTNGLAIRHIIPIMHVCRQNSLVGHGKKLFTVLIFQILAGGTIATKLEINFHINDIICDVTC